jgi:hypothetical protein
MPHLFTTHRTSQDVFPKEVFQCSGAKLLQPDYEPRYKAIYREADLEAGQAVARYGSISSKQEVSV